MPAVGFCPRDKVFYWLEGYATEYVQTYSGGLALSGIAVTDETPDDPGNSGGGCDAGLGIGTLAMMSVRFYSRRGGLLRNAGIFRDCRL
jgi:hypothetical protein